ncbi:hypothetical protein E2C01_034717 [Portunus trituberculatus]|uniref:Uncharacterized protein n=1 Tax=Portunus trituberculatus TaxID=210409 RepID=A0A5B7F3J6_PORTR|nr:hypothetical protein [Portunus trituberculatus]
MSKEVEKKYRHQSYRREWEKESLAQECKPRENNGWQC